MDNYIGKTIGRLLIIEELDRYITPSGQSKRIVKCKCKCGNIKNIRLCNILRGSTYSCGCYKNEVSIKNGKRNKKYNTYNLSGEYGIGYTSNTNEPFYFDLEDYEKIKDYCWFSHTTNKYPYYLMAKSSYNTHIYMHRLIANFPKKSYY